MPSNGRRSFTGVSSFPFEILTNDKLGAAHSGNWFLENNVVIARLDKLARNEDVQQKLRVPDCRWDLVVWLAGVLWIVVLEN